MILDCKVLVNYLNDALREKKFDFFVNDISFLIKEKKIFLNIEVCSDKVLDKENINELNDLISSYKEIPVDFLVKTSFSRIKKDLFQNQNENDDNVDSLQKKSSCSNKKEINKKKEKFSFDLIKNIIIVASGKGGVGKSTIASNLAISMAEVGWKVGLLDADIYGASIPTIFGLENHEIELNDEAFIVPIEKYGIKINSIEFITKSHEALIWRGPMLSKILDQLLKNTDWGDLDYLIVDTPPGTGDIHISLLENYNINGYLLVSTPHQTSINNTKKTQNMFERFAVPNVALVMNMTYVENNSEKLFIFQSGDNSILNIDQKNTIEIPILDCNSSNDSSLFIFHNEKYKKFFNNISRKVVESTELIVR